MSPKKDQLLVVVSIMSGRRFPKNSRFGLMVQASFGGEVLATDVTEHIEQPQFNTELAWELNRRTLHQHRLHRTPIKLNCFAVDVVSKTRESIGYIILDLRSAHEVKQEPRWCSLLSSKYAKMKPELLVALTLENDSKPPKSSHTAYKTRKAPPRQVPATGVSDKLEAVLVRDKGYHQVGPADRCSDMFVLSVTLAFGTNLEQLIPSTAPLSSEGSTFFFYYSLLGNDITSEPFHSLLRPEFEPERVSIRIRSSKEVLQVFFSQQPALQIHLCCGSLSLGSVEVFLSPLAITPLDLGAAEATIDGTFILQPPSRLRQQLPALPPDQLPIIGVTVILRREDLTPTQEQSQSFCRSAAAKDGHAVQTPSSPAGLGRGISALQKPPVSPPRPPPSSHTDCEVDRGFDERLCDDLEVPSEELDAAPPPPAAPKVPILPSAHHFRFSLDLCSLSTLRLTTPIAATLRYSYPFFGTKSPIVTNPPVELQRNMEVFLPQSFCSFNFATLTDLLHSAFERVPLVVELWHSHASSGDQLLGRASIHLSGLLSSEKTGAPSTAEQSSTQSRQEVVSVLSTLRPNEMVAELRYTATLEDLGLVKVTEVVRTGSSQQQRAPSCQAPPSYQVAAPPSVRPHAPTEVEFHAAHTTPAVPPNPPPAVPSTLTANAGPPAAPAPPAPPAPAVPLDPRATMEYRAALELELWKEEQQRLFDDQLKMKELTHMQVLVEELKKRDQEREAVVKKKEAEFTLLGEQIQKTLLDLERREKLLAEAELQTQRIQKELQAKRDKADKELQESSRRLQQECDQRVALERDRVRLLEEERGRLLQQTQRIQKELQAKRDNTEKELQESSRRLQQECDQRVALERDRVRLLEEERGRLLQQIGDGDRRYQQRDKEFHLYREQQGGRPEVHLQADIKLLTLEKVELERKLESTTKSKLHYKQQWGRALKELARFKQQEQENAMVRLKKQQDELEAMRLRYLATEELEVARRERQDLENIKNELNRLKVIDGSSGPAPITSDPAPYVPSAAPHAGLTESAEEHLNRLLNDRDMLVRTNLYMPEDPVISELNRHIQDAMRDMKHL